MNGSNHQEERDARPLHPCPVCLHKLCWNLRAGPVPYLTRLKTFCQHNGLDPESGWYEKAMVALAEGGTCHEDRCDEPAAPQPAGGD
jgi:hypothetical protein